MIRHSSPKISIVCAVWGLTLLLVLLHGIAVAQDQDPLAPPALPAEPEPDLPPAKTLWQHIEQRLFEEPTLLPPNELEALYQKLEEWKKTHHLPISIGAHNWFHINNNGPHTSGYGIPGLNGTYFYYLLADPRVYGGPLADKVGVHLEARFRDGNTPFRAYFPETAAYFYEAYGWIETPFGRLKGGAIVRRFGIEWDGSWWGNVQYFDGLKLNPDLGISLEETPEMTAGFKVDRYLQFFVRDYNVSGSIVGANPESVVGSRQVNTLMGRIVPTWALPNQSTLALGLSGFAGEIRNDPIIYLVGGNVLRQIPPGSPVPPGSKRAVGAWAADLTYTQGGLRVFGEFDQLYGTFSPSRYVSGGPSNRTTDLLAGFNYRKGPITYTFSFSAGFDSNPSGTQLLWVPGGVVALMSNVDLYINYVFWKVHASGAPQFTTFEDGVQMVFVWRY
jgi:hypothetical protein